MAIKITLKNSVVQDSVPTTTHLPAVGELALNANINSLGIYMRASDNTIVKMAGPGSLTTPTASTTVAGISEYATNTETTTGTSTTRSVTPAGLAAVTSAERSTSNSTYLALAGGTLTNPLVLPDASNSAPALTGADTDSGVYFATNSVSLAAGGTTRLTADTGVSVVGTLAVTGAITSTSDLTIADKIIHAGDTDTAIRFPAANTVSVESGGSEALRVDSSQRLLVGLTSARAIANLTTLQQIEGTDAASGLSITRNSASNEGGTLNFGKSRAAGLGGVTVIQDGDALGTINFSGADGTDLTNTAASIAGFINGTPGANDTPGKLVFGTTADGAASPTTRLTITSAGLVNVPDNGKFTAGASSDLEIYHDGTNSHLNNSTGYLVVGTDSYALKDQSLNEFYIKALKDGAVEIYYDGVKKLETTSVGAQITGRLVLDGGYLHISGSDLYLDDSRKAYFGAGSDLQIYHNGTDTYFTNTTGNTLIQGSAGNAVYIQGKAGEGSIVCAADGAVSLYYDGTRKAYTNSGGFALDSHLIMGDNVVAKFGNGADLQIYHNGVNSVIYDNGTGNLSIMSSGGSIVLEKSNGEPMGTFAVDGAVSLYYDNSKKFETTSYGVGVTGTCFATSDFQLNDGCAYKAGTGEDLQIYHNGSASYIQSPSHTLYIQATTIDIGNGAANEAKAKFIDNGAVELYYDNSLKLATSSAGVNITGELTVTTDLVGIDDSKLKLGNSSDLQIFHQNGYNYIYGSTPVYVQSNTVELQSQGGEKYVTCVNDGAVELYYNGSKKFNTHTGGTLTTGSMQANYGSGEYGAQINDSTTSGTHIQFQRQGYNNGNITHDNNNSAYNTSGSDRTLKKNFEDWTDSYWTAFKNLNPQKFHFLTDADSDPKCRGYIAQDLVATFPEAYPKEIISDKYMFNPSGMVPYLMKTLKEALTEIDTLKTEKTKLQTDLTALTARVAALEGA